MPEEDAPTETGTPGDRHVDNPEEDGDDTTTAEAGPPASHLRDEDDATNDADERTVERKVSSPDLLNDLARRPPPVSSPRPAATVASSPTPSSPPTAPNPPSIPPRLPSGARGPSKRAAARSVTDLEGTDLEVVDDVPSEESVTTMSPRPSVNLAGMVIPGSVEIRTVDDDELLDETEVRTLPGHVLPATLRAGPDGASQQPVISPRPAAGVPASVAAPPTPPEEDDDGVTAQAQSPRVGSSPELAASIGILTTSRGPATEPQALKPPVGGDDKLTDSVEEPLTRPGGIDGIEELLTRPGLGVPMSVRPRLPSLDGYANDEDDEGVTARGPAVEAADEDSVTTEAPAISRPMLAGIRASASSGPRGIGEANLDDSTDGTTKKLKQKTRPSVDVARADAARADASPADGEMGSITTQAPAPLTNILRVIASDPDPETAEDAVANIADEEEAEENRTAVMANAPLKRIVADVFGAPSPSGSGAIPAIRPTGPPLTVPQNPGPDGAVAAQLALSSESGLRASHTSGERAIMGGREADARVSGVGRANPTGPHDPRPFAATEVAFVPPPAMQPSLHDVQLGKGPRYGLLVGIVAVISFVVPVTLFVVLKGRSEDVATPAVPSEVATEFQQHDSVPRGKLRVVPTASASASASGSSSAHKPPLRPPFGRR